MTKRSILALAAAITSLAAVPAGATEIMPNSSGLTFTAFNDSTRGDQIAVFEQAGAAPTIAGRVVSAVYRNTMGTLDFYWQVFRTGGTNMIDGMNVGDFTGVTVNGFTEGMNFDGTGPFARANNSGDNTTTVGRTPSGDVVRIAFGANGLTGTENSTTFILRTNATRYTTGFATVTNSTAFNVAAFAPVATSAVPEPAGWAMMILGFGAIGATVRYRRRKSEVTAL